MAAKANDGDNEADDEDDTTEITYNVEVPADLWEKWTSDLPDDISIEHALWGLIAHDLERQGQD